MISVIIPIYNSADYLQQCLDSVISQTYSDLEIICVNDGSTDNSLQILEKNALNDTRIIVLSQDNAGVSAARNAGIEIAQGEYITFVDSDDKLELDMYEILIHLAHKYNADIAHCGYKKIHLDGTSKNVCGTGKLLIHNSAEASACLLTGSYFAGSPCNKLYRTKMIVSTRFCSELKINEDILFNAQLFDKSKVIVFFDIPKYHYFERENSACSRTLSTKKKQDAVNASNQILNIYRGSSVEFLAAEKLYYCLIDLYRAYIFDGIRKNRTLCNDLHKQVCQIATRCHRKAGRNQLNYLFMRNFSVIYKLVYTIYNKIRKPNWDI